MGPVGQLHGGCEWIHRVEPRLQQQDSDAETEKEPRRKRLERMKRWDDSLMWATPLPSHRLSEQ